MKTIPLTILILFLLAVVAVCITAGYSAIISKKNVKDIPVYVISFNNPTYLANIIPQILKSISKNVYVVDNASTFPGTLSLLKELESRGINILRMKENHGHRVVYTHVNTPTVYIVTDPDLQFNSRLPDNAVQHLMDISNHFQCEYVGFALELEDNLFFSGSNYFRDKSIMEWESQFWEHRLVYKNYDLYNADIDTTLKLHNKKYSKSKINCIRVAGNFACKHLPWYKNPIVPIPEEEYTFYKLNAKCSTIVNVH